MKTSQSFQNKLSKVFRHWEETDYPAALKIIDSLLEDFPGNGLLNILWASLVQLHNETEHTLQDAKNGLQRAVTLEKDSPAGHVELGYFLDAVEDNPQSALMSFAAGISTARHWLLAGLIGQAKSLLQLDKREEAMDCLMEAVYVLNRDSARTKHKSNDEGVDLLVSDSPRSYLAFQMKESLPRQITDLLQDLMLKKPV